MTKNCFSKKKVFILIMKLCFRIYVTKSWIFQHFMLNQCCYQCIHCMDDCIYTRTLYKNIKTSRIPLKYKYTHCCEVKGNH